MRFSYDEIARITGGRLTGEGSVVAERVSIDSRTAAPGDLFVALRGEHHDGHAFIPSIVSRISGCLVSKPVETSLPFVTVRDTTASLQALGRESARRLGAKIIAVTGSVGKTTTKAMILHLLGELVPGSVGTPGNRNSLIGVPLSFCNFPPSAPLAVVEMGMNHAGELDRLGSLFPPDILLYTAIAPVHTAFFPDINAVADAKGELLHHLKRDGDLIVNGEDAKIRHLASRWEGRTFMVGRADGNLRWRVIDDQGFSGGTILMETDDGSWRVRRSAGHLHPLSYALAFSLSVILDLDPERAVSLLSAFEPLEHRGKLLHVGDIDVLDDSYNASPAAVREALAAFKATPVTGHRVFLFGDMLELGDRAAGDHIEVGLQAARSVDHLVTVGPLAALAAGEMKKAGKTADACDDVDEAARILQSQIGAGDLLLVKGSRALQLERVISALEEAA